MPLTGAAIKEEDITAACCGTRCLPQQSVRQFRGKEPSRCMPRAGETALDRLYDGDHNPNSVFTRALLPALTPSDLDLPSLAVEVVKR